MHLQEVMAGARSRKFEEVEAVAARGDGRGEEKTCRRQMVRFDELTCRAGAHVLLHCGRQTRPPHRAPGKGEGLVAPEVPPPRGVAWSSCNTVSRSEPAAARGNPRAVAARPPTVQEDKGAMRTGDRGSPGRRGRAVEQRGRQGPKRGRRASGGDGGCEVGVQESRRIGSSPERRRRQRGQRMSRRARAPSPDRRSPCCGTVRVGPGPSRRKRLRRRVKNSAGMVLPVRGVPGIARRRRGTDTRPAG